MGPFLVRDSSGNRDGMFKFGKIDVARITDAFGCIGIRVEKPEALKPALVGALTVRHSVVIDVVTEPDHKPQEAWLPA